MGLSIQDYLKKINSWLSVIDIVSIFVIFLASSVFAGYLWHKEQESRVEVIYRVSSDENRMEESLGVGQGTDNGKPFGSRKGKTYTFSWCSGSGNIKPGNKIYFSSPTDAEANGRTLSKLCKK